jgi:hypothetical protein
VRFLVTGKETEPPTLFLRKKLMGTLYILGIGKRYSVICGEADAPEVAYFRHLEGSFPARRELVEPFSVQYSP